MARLDRRRGFASHLWLAGIASAALVTAFQRGIWLPLVLCALAPLGFVPWSGIRRRYVETRRFESLRRLLIVSHRPSYLHGRRIAQLARRTALRLGLHAASAGKIARAALLHDIGKIHIRREILEKPGPLTAEEYEIVKQHPKVGAKLLSENSLCSFSDWILHHHERVDGSGYPHGIALEQIPIESRIIAVVDAFDAMTETDSCRCYRTPRSRAEALDELRRCAGSQFDPQVVDAFVAVLTSKFAL